MIRKVASVIPLLSLVLATEVALGQDHAPGHQGSSNMHIVAHIPSGGEMRVGDIEIEQELSRPYAYVSLALSQPSGFNVIDLRNPSKATQIYQWRIENPELHLGLGALRGRYFKVNGRYYYAQCFQFFPGGPDADLGLVVFDVTGLPDPAKVKEVTRIRAPYAPGGFHDLYAYKHSNGQVLVFTSVAGKPYANVFDGQKMVSGDANGGLISRIPNPSTTDASGAGFSIVGGYHDYFVGYDPATKQDKFYGAGNGGYFIYDVSNPLDPRLITSVTGVAGMSSGHTFTPTPDGRYAVAETEYQYAPLRIFDLKPGLDGTVKTISRPIGAWTARWQGLPHNHEVRWPYVFVSAYEDGLQVFNMMDPTNPYTVAYYDTYDGPNQAGCCNPDWITGASKNPKADGVDNGAFGVQVRNADGLIVISDITTGFWAFKMDGFDGWNGHQWGMPNVSSAQDWDNGPDGAPKPGRVS
jgi:hypothetical protein